MDLLYSASASASGSGSGDHRRPADPAQKTRLALKAAKRSIDRDIRKSEQEEGRAKVEIQALAKKGDLEGARRRACDLVRQRTQIKWMRKMVSQISTLQGTLKRTQTVQQITLAMRDITRNMLAMNSQLKLDSLASTIETFQKQCDLLDDNGEAMEEILTQLDPEQQAESDELVNRVLDEMGIDLMTKFPAKPTKREVQADQERLAKLDTLDLEARLNGLRVQCPK